MYHQTANKIARTSRPIGLLFIMSLNRSSFDWKWAQIRPSKFYVSSPETFWCRQRLWVWV